MRAKPKFTLDYVREVVHRFPGLTTHELGKALKLPTKRKVHRYGILNAALHRAWQAGMINRVLLPGIHRKELVYRNFPIPTLPAGKIPDWYKNPNRHAPSFTVRIATHGTMQGDTAKACATFADLVINLMPQFTPEEVKQIIAAAVVQRLDPHPQT